VSRSTGRHRIRRSLSSRAQSSRAAESADRRRRVASERGPDSPPSATRRPAELLRTSRVMRASAPALSVRRVVGHYGAADANKALGINCVSGCHGVTIPKTHKRANVRRRVLDLLSNCRGGMAEWSMAVVLKTSRNVARFCAQLTGEIDNRSRDGGMPANEPRQLIEGTLHDRSRTSSGFASSSSHQGGVSRSDRADRGRNHQGPRQPTHQRRASEWYQRSCTAESAARWPAQLLRARGLRARPRTGISRARTD
jgi:hypothetical protein